MQKCQQKRNNAMCREDAVLRIVDLCRSVPKNEYQFEAICVQCLLDYREKRKCTTLKCHCNDIYYISPEQPNVLKRLYVETQ